MKSKIFLVWLLLVFAAWIYSAQQIPSKKISPNSQKQPPVKQSVIDLAFCLDTTGSMSGLIEGAKQKIWSIVNTVASAQPKPTLRIALVAYRDHGDSYITRVFDFTSDLESMYSQLRSLNADGGGDTPEDVNRALDEAVHHLQWSKNTNALKILYLVGDAPPHMDYQEAVDYRAAAHNAARRGIIINTIQCGQMPDTRPVWQEISRLAEGKYASIDQSGGMIAVNSPYDADLSRLSSELSSTYVPYGAAGEDKKTAQITNDSAVLAASPAVAAERAAAKSSTLYRNESWDLVDAVKNKTVKLEALRKDDLPGALQNKPVEEQRRYLDQQAQQRARIQQKIQDLTKKRDGYVAKQTEKLAGAKDAFDAQVLQTLKDQGKEKGIEFQR